MYLTFKSFLNKSWTLLDDKLVYGNKEILFSDIQSVKLSSKPTFGTSGIIEIIVNNKTINLAYSNSSKLEGDKALEYLSDKYGGKDLNEIKDISDVRDEIEALPYKEDLGNSKEINELPAILNKDENIKAIVSGIVENCTALIVCTNKRILIIDKGTIYGSKLNEMSLDEINSIAYSKGIILGKISIIYKTTMICITSVPNNTIAFFVDEVNKELNMYKEDNIPVSEDISSKKTISIADELIKYKQLLDSGALTQEEFDAKKKELL